MTTEQQDSSEARKDNLDKLINNAIRGLLWLSMSFLSAIYIQEDSPFSAISTTVTIVGFLIACVYGVKAVWFGIKAIGWVRKGK